MKPSRILLYTSVCLFTGAFVISCFYFSKRAQYYDDHRCHIPMKARILHQDDSLTVRWIFPLNNQTCTTNSILPPGVTILYVDNPDDIQKCCFAVEDEFRQTGEFWGILFALILFGLLVLVVWIIVPAIAKNCLST